jgi:hypothetical protein
VDPTKRRVINTPVIRYTDKGERYAARSMTLFGFMSLNGEDVAMASQQAKAVDMVSFLEAVRGANGRRKRRRPIIIVVDNARIHTAKVTKMTAADLSLYLVFLPPYSPDLQPIESGWKDLKRELAARLDFDGMIDASGPAALRLFHERKETYAAHWTESFITERS